MNVDANISISLIGAGQMGSGIGQVFASAGFLVKIHDLSEDIFEKSQSRIIDSLEKLKAKDRLHESVVVVQQRISYHKNLDELRGGNIFIESALEDFSTKVDIFRKLSKILSPSSLVATNTSSYSITTLSQMIPWPEKFVGFHFMNPPPLMKLLEVIRGLHTSESTFNFFWELAKSLGKTPVESRNSPGFVLNRVLIPMINEAIQVLYEGIASIEHIDETMRLGANHPMGPLALADLIGLDTVLAIMRTLHREMGDDKYLPCPLLENYVSGGRLGRKTKIGFYEYS
ncbi:MAG: 3-hydroxybutyryl-CoA dehydrogenase [Holosporaceae bacterium]|jgi:3-hydroxybutyryl-CoA dehydrogenase|nr:3-hydroxybutyryl-CoA dehydrogenase [Holosporaceae bacterium]